MKWTFTWIFFIKEKEQEGTLCIYKILKLEVKLWKTKSQVNGNIYVMCSMPLMHAKKFLL